MTDQIKNVVVIGASGNLGVYVLQELTTSGFNVSVLSRETSKATFPGHVVVHKTDYSEQSLLEVFKGQDAVVSCIATFSTQEQMRIVNAACKAGIKRFIPSEYGVDTSPANIRECLPPAQAKQDTVAHLRTKEREGMSWTAICVGAWFDWVLRLGGGAMGWDIHAQKATIYDSGDQPYEATNVAQVAKAVASTLTHLLETENQYIYIHSFTLTQNKVLAAFEAATGKEWDVTRATTKDLFNVGMEKLKGRTDAGAMEVITAAIYGNGGLNHFGDRAVKFNEMLGLKEEDLATVVKSLIKE